MASDLDYHAEILGNRLKKRYKHLRKWATRNDVTCFRVYDRDIPEVPLVVDLYDRWLHIAEYHSPHKNLPGPPERYRDAMVDTARRALGIDPARVAYKTRRITARDEQYERMDSAAATEIVREGGLRFKVNLTDYLDTGLFLDHRQTRSIVRDRVREMAVGKTVRMLNLFSYTGSFTVYAADGGARTVSVDMSRTYTDWAAENAALNGLLRADHEFVTEDVFDYLKKARPHSFDLIVLDPPTFSNSKRMERTLDIQRDHGELLSRCSELLSRDGVLVFSTNRRGFRLTDAPQGATVRDITSVTIPPDFRDRRVHQCWVIEPAYRPVPVGATRGPHASPRSATRRSRESSASSRRGEPSPRRPPSRSKSSDRHRRPSDR
ncbi:MAG: methyltransferase domain-containing protein [Spirochaetaceae bacterium]|nr:MAG: methyltransferase domain-containing protein [Spirochaetaceae bacterium]